MALDIKDDEPAQHKEDVDSDGPNVEMLPDQSMNVSILPFLDLQVREQYGCRGDAACKLQSNKLDSFWSARVSDGSGLSPTGVVRHTLVLRGL
jgi:hypothetical protein